MLPIDAMMVGEQSDLLEMRRTSVDGVGDDRVGQDYTVLGFSARHAHAEFVVVEWHQHHASLGCDSSTLCGSDPK